MSESTTTAAMYSNASGYWKLCTMVLGVGFIIAVASHSGPASASAHANSPNLLIEHQTQAAVQAQEVLSIGGFDMINGQASFVILNENGQRVGTLPMAAANAD